MEQSGDQITPHSLAEAQFAHRRVDKFANAQQVVEYFYVAPVTVERNAINSPEKLKRLDHRQVPPELSPLAEYHSHAAGVFLAVFVGNQTGHVDFTGRGN